MGALLATPRRIAQTLAIAVLCGALVPAFAAAPAHAQAPPPIGHWVTQGSVEELWVFSNGNCGFYFKKQLRVAGRCSLNASSRGGILDIVYPMPLQPGHVRYSCVYVNRTTMSVFGDIFHKV